MPPQNPSVSHLEILRIKTIKKQCKHDYPEYISVDSDEAMDADGDQSQDI